MLRVDLTSEAVARFWRNVCRTDACWFWLGYVKNGYGCLEVLQEPVYAHRFSYALHFGETPDELDVLHHCDVPLCVRPDHLFLGTQADNVDDMWAKGRAVPPPIHQGESHHEVTLTDAQVAGLRSLHRNDPTLTQREIAARYGVSQSTVWRLIHGRTRSAA